MKWKLLFSTSNVQFMGKLTFCAIFRVVGYKRSFKVVPDAASLRHEFRVSTGRKAILWRKMHAKWRNGGFLIDFLPVETRNSCLSEASSVTTFKVVTDAPSLRHEFRVSTGRKAILWRKMHAKWRNGGFLIDFLGFFPVETRNSCLSEASSVTTFICYLFKFIHISWLCLK